MSPTISSSLKSFLRKAEKPVFAGKNSRSLQAGNLERRCDSASAKRRSSSTVKESARGSTSLAREATRVPSSHDTSQSPPCLQNPPAANAPPPPAKAREKMRPATSLNEPHCTRCAGGCG